MYIIASVKIVCIDIPNNCKAWRRSDSQDQQKWREYHQFDPRTHHALLNSCLAINDVLWASSYYIIYIWHIFAVVVSRVIDLNSWKSQNRKNEMLMKWEHERWLSYTHSYIHCGQWCFPSLIYYSNCTATIETWRLSRKLTAKPWKSGDSNTSVISFIYF